MLCCNAIYDQGYECGGDAGADILASWPRILPCPPAPTATANSTRKETRIQTTSHLMIGVQMQKQQRINEGSLLFMEACLDLGGIYRVPHRSPGSSTNTHNEDDIALSVTLAGKETGLSWSLAFHSLQTACQRDDNRETHTLGRECKQAEGKANPNTTLATVTSSGFLWIDIGRIFGILNSNICLFLRKTSTNGALLFMRTPDFGGACFPDVKYQERLADDQTCRK